mmetsp:Transcript_35922/g.66178  ORF Transcript_35922/g.66178 Transcript_35922/m.66178 type:complete len:810 (+) Transcript_35922:177-2606(+)
MLPPASRNPDSSTRRWVSRRSITPHEIFRVLDPLGAALLRGTLPRRTSLLRGVRSPLLLLGTELVRAAQGVVRRRGRADGRISPSVRGLGAAVLRHGRSSSLERSALRVLLVSSFSSVHVVGGVELVLVENIILVLVDVVVGELLLLVVVVAAEVDASVFVLLVVELSPSGAGVHVAEAVPPAFLLLLPPIGPDRQKLGSEHEEKDRRASDEDDAGLHEELGLRSVLDHDHDGDAHAPRLKDGRHADGDVPRFLVLRLDVSGLVGLEVRHEEGAEVHDDDDDDEREGLFGRARRVRLGGTVELILGILVEPFPLEGGNERPRQEEGDVDDQQRAKSPYQVLPGDHDAVDVRIPVHLVQCPSLGEERREGDREADHVQPGSGHARRVEPGLVSARRRLLLTEGDDGTRHDQTAHADEGQEERTGRPYDAAATLNGRPSHGEERDEDDDAHEDQSRDSARLADVIHLLVHGGELGRCDGGAVGVHELPVVALDGDPLRDELGHVQFLGDFARVGQRRGRRLHGFFRCLLDDVSLGPLPGDVVGGGDEIEPDLVALLLALQLHLPGIPHRVSDALPHPRPGVRIDLHGPAGALERHVLPQGVVNVLPGRKVEAGAVRSSHRSGVRHGKSERDDGVVHEVRVLARVGAELDGSKVMSAHGRIDLELLGTEVLDEGGVGHGRAPRGAEALVARVGVGGWGSADALGRVGVVDVGGLAALHLDEADALGGDSKVVVLLVPSDPILKRPSIHSAGKQPHVLSSRDALLRSLGHDPRVVLLPHDGDEVPVLGILERLDGVPDLLPSLSSPTTGFSIG